jgi:hypothetical protein
VEDDDRTRLDAPADPPLGEPAPRHVRVDGIHQAEGAAEAVALDDVEHRIVVVARPRPEPADVAEGRERPRGPRETVLELLRVELDAGLGPHHVIAQLVALGDDLGEQPLVPADPLAENEEGRAGTVPPQQIQERRRRFGIGTIVQGESDYGLRHRRRVEDPRVAVAEEPEGAVVPVSESEGRRGGGAGRDRENRESGGERANHGPVLLPKPTGES